MQLTKIALFGLVGIAAAAPLNHNDRLRSILSGEKASVVSERSASTIESDISTISSDVTTLTSQISSFTGSIIQGLSLLVTFDDLEGDINTGTSDVKSTGTLSSSDSATIYSDVSALTTKITTALTAATAKVSYSHSITYTDPSLSSLLRPLSSPALATPALSSAPSRVSRYVCPMGQSTKT
jgi:hypothetical protein